MALSAITMAVDRLAPSITVITKERIRISIRLKNTVMDASSLFCLLYVINFLPSYGAGDGVVFNIST